VPKTREIQPEFRLVFKISGGVNENHARFVWLGTENRLLEVPLCFTMRNARTSHWATARRRMCMQRPLAAGRGLWTSPARMGQRHAVARRTDRPA